MRPAAVCTVVCHAPVPLRRTLPQPGRLLEPRARRRWGCDGHRPAAGGRGAGTAGGDGDQLRERVGALQPPPLSLLRAVAASAAALALVSAFDSRNVSAEQWACAPSTALSVSFAASGGPPDAVGCGAEVLWLASQTQPALGYGGDAAVFSESELPVAVIALFGMAAVIVVRNNRRALMVIHAMVAAGFALLGLLFGMG